MMAHTTVVGDMVGHSNSEFVWRIVKNSRQSALCGPGCGKPVRLAGSSLAPDQLSALHARQGPSSEEGRV